MAKAQNHRPVEFASHLLTDHQSFGICQMVPSLHSTEHERENLDSFNKGIAPELCQVS